MELSAIVTALNGPEDAKSLLDSSIPMDNIESKISTTGITHISAYKDTSFNYVCEKMARFACANGISSPTHILTCTQTPDRLIPAPSLELLNCFEEWREVKFIDLRTGCTGFVDCAMIADLILRSNNNACIYCFTGDISSRMIDPSDYATKLVFGDAINLSVFETIHSHQTINLPTNKLHAYESYVDKRFKDAIFREEGNMQMDGLNVLSFVMQSVVPFLIKYIENVEKKIDLAECSLILHQANAFIVDKINKKINNKFTSLTTHNFSMSNIGNSSSSTIPIAIANELVEREGLKRNIIMCGFGAGMATHAGMIKLSSSILSRFLKL